MIVGQEKPDAGELRIGDTVKLAYVDQSRDAPRRPTRPSARRSRAAATCIEVGKPRDARPRLRRRRSTSRARPAEEGRRALRRRAQPASTWPSCSRRGGNLLLLDEPTNDLDVDTLRALEEALLDFAGCAVVISHDRWFLDRIATHILAFEGDSRVVWFEGNYADYEADKKRRLGAEADRPHRATYRRLVRD